MFFFSTARLTAIVTVHPWKSSLVDDETETPMPCFFPMPVSCVSKVSLGRCPIDSERGCAQFYRLQTNCGFETVVQDTNSAVEGVSVSLTAMGTPLPRRSACYY